MPVKPSAVLSPTQAQFYKDNGYLVVEDLFPKKQLDTVLQIYEDRADKATYAGIMNLDREVKEVFDLVADPKIVDILETLQEGPVSLLQTMFLFKKKQSTYSTQSWNPHQDNAYPQAKVGAYITGNITFNDQDAENGGMYIFPGSHKEGMLPNKPVPSFHEKPGENPGNIVEVPPQYESKRIDLILKSGSLLMLHGCVIHGSYPNNSPTRSRPPDATHPLHQPRGSVRPGKNREAQRSAAQSLISL